MKNGSRMTVLTLFCCFLLLQALSALTTAAQDRCPRAAGATSVSRPGGSSGTPESASKGPTGTEVKDPNPPSNLAGGDSPKATGGPDAFGYFYIDSAEPGGPAFSWVDISATGTNLGSGDDATSQVVLSAPFNFYGTNYSALQMGTNGYLSTDPSDAGGDLSNDCATFPVAPSTGGGGRFYVLHDDLNISSGNSGSMYSQYFASCPRPSDALTGEPCTVCQWHNAVHWGGQASLTSRPSSTTLRPISFTSSARETPKRDPAPPRPSWTPPTRSASSTPATRPDPSPTTGLSGFILMPALWD